MLAYLIQICRVHSNEWQIQELNILNKEADACAFWNLKTFQGYANTHLHKMRLSSTTFNLFALVIFKMLSVKVEMKSMTCLKKF